MKGQVVQCDNGNGQIGFCVSLNLKDWRIRKMQGVVEKAKKIIQDIVLPELEVIKGENRDIKTILELTNKRLDDITAHLVDQSRRIDEMNRSLIARIDETNNRLIVRIDETNNRINKLYEVIVRREEHDKLEIKIVKIEQDIAEIKEKIQYKIAA